MKFHLRSVTFSLALATVVSFAGSAFAAAESAPAKRPIDHTDFDSWKGISTAALSRDGKWLAYSLQPQSGDGELVIREIATGKETHEPVGMLPPPSLTPDPENPDAPPVPRFIRVAFTSDSRFVVATTYPYKAQTAAARSAKKKPEEMPKGGLLIIELAGHKETRIANVRGVQVPAKSGSLIVYLKEPAEVATAKPVATQTAANDEDADVTDQAASAGRGGEGEKKVYGSDLVLRDLASDKEITFPDVIDPSPALDGRGINYLARDGATLVYAVSSRSEAANGVYMLNTHDAAPTPYALMIGKGRYSKLIWDREQTQAVFLSDRDDAAAKMPAFKIYRWVRGEHNATELLSAAAPGFPQGMVVSERGAGGLAFSRDGRKLYIPAAEPEHAAPPTPSDEDKVVADLWRWNDDVVQPVQKVHATQDKNRSYRGVYDLSARVYVQLADKGLRTVSLSDSGERAIGVDDAPYRRMSDYDGTYADIYVINPATGARKLAVQKLKLQGRSGPGGEQWSPDGKWVYYYADKNWHLLNTADGSTRNLTAKLGVAVYDEQHDAPDPAGPYGAAGWMSDSSGFVVYDRYDVWELFADGRAAKNLTRSVGRNLKVRLRVQRVEPIEEGEDERGFDAAKPLTLRGESEETRATGFYTTRFDATGVPDRLLWADKNFRYAGRALDADVLLLTASRFDTYPDLQLTQANFAKLDKVSDGGAQMAPFLWGTGELMAFRNAKGVPLQAAVYKPANFDPKKKYPLLVYIYERLSQNVHNFVNPGPGQNINFAQYTSNGYIVMAPDIVYTAGAPGKNALDCVLPAIDTLVKQGFVDEKAIGIQGHSWGGYQIAYMVTQTHRFRAAEAGAPVGNMTSAYSGIRWGSGLPRQFQYEAGQSRIGKPLQEAPNLYIASSAIFQIRNVQTPLLIIANDNDDAVPWYQGIELFLALRRYNKEAYYFNYNGEFHGLRRRADQKDYARRLQQYFDHFLKGAPAPEWMEKGIPYLEREEEKIAFPKKKVAAAQ